MKRETPASLFERWRAYYRVAPFGDDWLQAGTVAAASANPHIKKPIPVEDFIPSYGGVTEQTPDEIWGELMRFSGGSPDAEHFGNRNSPVDAI